MDKSLKHGTALKIKSPTDQPSSKLEKQYFLRDVLEIAPGLPGKILVLNNPGDIIIRYMITEVEAYRGEEDLACHACRGRTARTDVLYREGGTLYIYLIYGMYWMLNIVTGRTDQPQAALIRGVEGYPGPGRLTRGLGIDKSYNYEDITASPRIWIEDAGIRPAIKTGPRIGVDYAGEVWKNMPWRYYIG